MRLLTLVLASAVAGAPIAHDPCLLACVAQADPHAAAHEPGGGPCYQTDEAAGPSMAAVPHGCSYTAPVAVRHSAQDAPPTAVFTVLAIDDHEPSNALADRIAVNSERPVAGPPLWGSPLRI